MLYSVNAVIGLHFTWCILYSVYTVLGVCCTRCMLYSVYAVLGVCCTQCMLHSVNAVLGVCCTGCQLIIMVWRDREGWLNSVFSDDGRVMDENDRDEGWRWEQHRGYGWIWDIRDTTCLIGLGRPRSDVITHRIATDSFCIVDSTVTHTWHSLSPGYSWLFAPSLVNSLILIFNSTIT